jgi:uncharacterized protein (DUF1697 family)
VLSHPFGKLRAGSFANCAKGWGTRGFVLVLRKKQILRSAQDDSLMVGARYTRCVMTVVISMLRGVNVGGHNKIKMDALRALYVSLKLEDVTTFIQSGNVVFRTKERELAKVGKRIGDGIEKSFGFRPEVILRTVDEMRGVVARNPFAGRKDVEPGKLLVWFLAAEPEAEARKKVFTVKMEQEEIRIEERELYIYFPDGQGRSKLSMGAVERALKVSGTGRNWNSVLKLLEMAEGLDGAG